MRKTKKQDRKKKSTSISQNGVRSIWMKLKVWLKERKTKFSRLYLRPKKTNYKRAIQWIKEIKK